MSNIIPPYPLSDAVIKVYENRKNRYLAYSLLLDLLGAATYALPFVGEIGDVIYAPFYAICIFILYRRKIISASLGGVGGFVEEIMPGTDFIPTATLMWVYTFIVKKDSSLKAIAQKHHS